MTTFVDASGKQAYEQVTCIKVKSANKMGRPIGSNGTPIPETSGRNKYDQYVKADGVDIKTGNYTYRYILSKRLTGAAGAGAGGNYASSFINVNTGKPWDGKTVSWKAFSYLTSSSSFGRIINTSVCGTSYPVHNVTAWARMNGGVLQTRIKLLSWRGWVDSGWVNGLAHLSYKQSPAYFSSSDYDVRMTSAFDVKATTSGAIYRHVSSNMRLCDPKVNVFYSHNPSYSGC
ncbi:MAG: hypothetical protein CUN56_00625 [Phototrophicales bacterium]|nr:MAG: hypothetical protein CUN56_00625 [Phototrophicales bacterium]